MEKNFKVDDNNENVQEQSNNENEQIEVKNNENESENISNQSFQINIKLRNNTNYPIYVDLSESIIEIKQLLYDLKDIWFVTSYSLCFNDVELNDMSELNQIEGFKENSELVMKDIEYNDKTAKSHIRRFKDILLDSNRDVATESLLSSFQHDSKNQQKEDDSNNNNENQKKGKKRRNKKKKNKKVEEEIEEIDFRSVQFKNFFSKSKESSFALSKLTYSGWNPPLGSRLLQGDLFYIEALTLENKTFHITASTNGFFVNKSTYEHFNPDKDPSYHEHHTLVELFLEISPSFEQKYKEIVFESFSKHPFENLPIPFCLNTPWIGKQLKHTYDLSRSEDFFQLQAETESLANQMREWNTEFQTIKEFPKDTLQQRIIRDRQLFHINCEFVNSAVIGVVNIIQKTITPINPLSPPNQHIYLYNNIFFSQPIYDDPSDKNQAYKSMNNDFTGIKILNEVDYEGVHSALSAIFSLAGKRFLAQSVIPGLINSDPNLIQYGISENGDMIQNEEFHEEMKKLGEKLYLKEQEVVDKNEKKFKLITNVETKGVVGTDGRKYVEIGKIIPDMNYPDSPTAVCRTELVDHYMNALRGNYIEALNVKLQEDFNKRQLEKHKELQGEDGEVSELSKEQEKMLTEEYAAFEKQKNQVILESLRENFQPKFNINCFDKFVGEDRKVVAEGEEAEAELKADQSMLTELSKSFLLKNVIPGIVEQFRITTPIDGSHLKELLHSRGINLRYLGVITKLAEGHEKTLKKYGYIKKLCLSEMLTRSAKHIINETVSEAPSSEVGNAIIHMVNCFLATAKAMNENEHIKKSKKKKKKKNGPANFVEKQYGYDIASFFDRLVEETKIRFNFDLSQQTIDSPFDCLPLLRSICKKIGVQLVARNYDFSTSYPLNNSDILTLFPIIKHINSASQNGRELLEAAITYMSHNRLDLAYEFLTESIAIFHQTCGPMHEYTAECYFYLSKVVYSTGDIHQAINHQVKALIIQERVLGLDSHQSAQGYYQLAFYCHQLGQLEQALIYLEQARFLNNLIFGFNNPNNIEVFFLMSKIYQSLKQYQKGLDIALLTLSCIENLNGSNNIQTSECYHFVAISYSYVNDFRKALEYERKRYAIISQLFHPSDSRIADSNIWLKQFTAKAVQSQIEKKKVQQTITSKISEQKLNSVKKDLNQSSFISSSNNSPSSITFNHNSSLNDIIKYINGSPNNPSSKNNNNTNNNNNNINDFSSFNNNRIGRKNVPSIMRPSNKFFKSTLSEQ
eukprot:TRINITY_DN1324_c0_g1_i1.p1 TRINITY_DN1324_c0_g1~~TRINITY_DN1324_c0_g1_i1.p1  ORF type:complete len:1254 (+),score=435.05 TRINITY_DN1324_c0_g1_i1:33-3794(+)